MRRLEKMEVEKKEAQAIDLKAAEARSTCEECREYGHVQKNCPEEAKMLDYMKKAMSKIIAQRKPRCSTT